MTTDRSLSRRKFLRGVGTVMALPSLEALAPFAGKAAEGHVMKEGGKAAAASIPTRMAFIYSPNGVIVPQWRPKGEGPEWELSPTLSALKNVKSDIQVITGLEHDKARPNGDGAGDHARANSTFLTGTQIRKTAGADIKAGVSVDQIAAQHIGQDTWLDSLQLGCDPGRQAGKCDSGYSCAYQFNMSWRSDSLPLAPEIDPRLVFEKLFGNRDSKESAESRERRRRREASILDFVMEDAKSLQGDLGYTDQQKLEEYLTGVRDLERRIENAEKIVSNLPNIEQPTGIPDGYREHVRMMYDLMALAFQTDTTRIGSFLVAHDGSNRSFQEIGVPEGHHHLSHHRNDPAKIDKIARIDRFYIEQFAYFLEKLRDIKEADGSSLLDHSMIVYGGAISDGDRHNHDDLPVILAGKGGGTLRAGRHVVTRQPVPMTNMYLTMLDKIGCKQERLGDSSGRFDLI